MSEKLWVKFQNLTLFEILRLYKNGCDEQCEIDTNSFDLMIF